MHCGDQNAANERFGDYEKMNNAQKDLSIQARAPQREPLIKRNQYILMRGNNGGL